MGSIDNTKEGFPLLVQWNIKVNKYVTGPHRSRERPTERKPRTTAAGSVPMTTTINTSFKSSIGPGAPNAAPESAAGDSGLMALYRKLYRPAVTYDGGPRGPHPGDVIYWIACLGAAFLLILAAT